MAVVTPVETSSTSKKCYKAALYGRLSYVRHGKEAESEETIENQMDLLRAFVNSRKILFLVMNIQIWTVLVLILKEMDLIR